MIRSMRFVGLLSLAIFIPGMFIAGFPAMAPVMNERSPLVEEEASYGVCTAHQRSSIRLRQCRLSSRIIVLAVRIPSRTPRSSDLTLSFLERAEHSSRNGLGIPLIV
jgi:hypothetical protein